jgi:hypothetical protein
MRCIILIFVVPSSNKNSSPLTDLNLTFEDLDKAINVKAVFKQYASYYCPDTKDLYFYGIKHGGSETFEVPIYKSDNCRQTS